MNNVPVQHLAGSLYSHSVHYKFYTCKVAYIYDIWHRNIKKKKKIVGKTDLVHQPAMTITYHTTYIYIYIYIYI